MNLEQYLKKNFDIDVVPVKVTTDNISSGTAADGAVLTADGAGGAAYEALPIQVPPTFACTRVLNVTYEEQTFQISDGTTSAYPEVPPDVTFKLSHTFQQDYIFIYFKAASVSDPTKYYRPLAISHVVFDDATQNPLLFSYTFVPQASGYGIRFRSTVSAIPIAGQIIVSVIYSSTPL